MITWFFLTMGPIRIRPCSIFKWPSSFKGGSNQGPVVTVTFSKSSLAHSCMEVLASGM